MGQKIFYRRHLSQEKRSFVPSDRQKLQELVSAKILFNHGKYSIDRLISDTRLSKNIQPPSNKCDYGQNHFRLRSMFSEEAIIISLLLCGIAKR